MALEGQEENYNIFRWYKTGWGRYTQADPARAGDDTNLYRYAGNSPVTEFDSLGLFAEVVCKDISPSGYPIKGVLHCRIRATCNECGSHLDETFGMEYTGAPYGMKTLPFPTGMADYYVRRPIDHPGMTDCNFFKCLRAYNKLFGKDYTGGATKYVPKYSAT